jgi:hypothetical protein
MTAALVADEPTYAVPLPTRKGAVITRWLITTDHRTIGNLYLISSMGFFLVGGGLMALIGRRSTCTTRTWRLRRSPRPTTACSRGSAADRRHRAAGFGAARRPRMTAHGGVLGSRQAAWSQAVDGQAARGERKRASR